MREINGKSDQQRDQRRQVQQQIDEAALVRLHFSLGSGLPFQQPLPETMRR